jgi:predicted phosphodiesterase
MKRLLLVVLLLAALLSWALPVLAPAGRSAGGQIIVRGPYLQSVTPSSVWVVWDTAAAAIGRVAYGPTPALGITASQEQPEAHHEVQLTGLAPGSVYYYSVNQGETASFHSAPAPGVMPFRFAVLGDTRTGNQVHQAIVGQIVSTAPDFVIHTGDLAASGNDPVQWQTFFDIEEPLLRTAPLYPTLGNHEDNTANYYASFHLPGNEAWYAFDYGNARFICLKVDDNPASVPYPDEEQMTWLEQQLASNTASWLIVYFHISMYTSRGEDALQTGLRERLEPLFQRYGVDIVFTGHNHSYERLLENGITQIVTAGGGAPLYALNNPEPGSQVRASRYNFVLVDVSDDRLSAQAIDQNGDVIDRFQLTARQR